MTDGYEKRIEPRVPIPEGASPEEVQRLIDEEVAQETDGYVDETVGKMLDDFFK